VPYVTSTESADGGVRRIVLAANPEQDQPWVAAATLQLARETNASIAVVSVDELETQLLSTLPRVEHQKYAEAAATAALERLEAAGVAKHSGRGRRSGEFLEFAEEQDVGLFVLGPSRRAPRRGNG
jgi:hypothetical protein